MKYNPFFFCPCADGWLQALWRPRKAALCAAEIHILMEVFQSSRGLAEISWEGGGPRKKKKNMKEMLSHFPIWAPENGKRLLCAFLKLDLFKRSHSGNNNKNRARRFLYMSYLQAEHNRGKEGFDLGKCFLGGKRNQQRGRQAGRQRDRHLESGRWYKKKKKWKLFHSNKYLSRILHMRYQFTVSLKYTVLSHKPRY